MRKLKVAFFVLLSWIWPLKANNLVFIFHSAATTAEIYDADTLQLLASPNVGTGAVRAFGAPDPNNPGQLLKLYVITANTVVVLNPQTFAIRATLNLPGALAAGPNASALTGDGKRLLVAAGGQVNVINTTDASDAIAAAIATPAPPTGIVVLPNSRRAYVMLSGSPAIQIIDLSISPPGLTSVTASLPLGILPAAIGIAPNGSRIYVSATDGINEIDRVSNSPAKIAAAVASSFNFVPDAPVPSAVLNAGVNAPVLDLAARTVGPFPFTISGAPTISKVTLPGAGRVFLLAGSPGHLYQGQLSAGGLVSEVVNPQTSAVLGPNAVDMEASPDGSKLFVAFSDGKFLKLDPAGTAAPVAKNTLSSTSALSLVYAPAVQATTLEIYGGDHQTVAASTILPAPLAVRALANGFPVFGASINFSSATTGVQLDSPVTTNLMGVAESQVFLPVATAVQVQAGVGSGGSATPLVFNLNSGSTGPSILNKISGDHQLVVQNTAFPFLLVVQTAPNTTLSVGFPAAVNCPSQVTTDLNGMASIQCSALSVTSLTAVSINVTDPFGNTLPDPFHANIVVSNADLPASVTLQTSVVPLTGMVQQTIPNAIEVQALKADGTNSPEVGVLFTSQPSISFNPILAVTSGGAASTSITFGCSLGAGSITATLQAPGSPSASVTFTATPGPLAQILKKQGDNQSGSPGQRLDGPGQALVVQLTDACGNPLSNQPVAWTVSAGSATLENAISVTDFRGNASALVRLGNTPGAVTVTATSGSFSANFSLTVRVVASQLVVVSGNNQNVAAGQTAAEPLVVQVQDSSGIGVSGINVAFSVFSGSVTLGSTQATTDAQGRASTSVRAGSTLGPVTIVATAVNRTVSFNLTVVGRVPSVSSLGFVNGASFQPGWVPGSTGTIFGVGLGEGVNGVAAAGQAPFPTTLQGVQVTVAGVSAPIISLANVNGQEQINIQVPFNIPAPEAATVVINNNGSSASFQGVQILPVQPGIFEFNSGGTLLAAALHTDFSVVTAANPAHPGEIILLFLTGLGATTPPVGTNVGGPTSPLAATVVQPMVAVNGQPAQVLGSWYAPLLYTAYQINFVIPSGASPGLNTITVTAGGVSSQTSRIPVQ